MRVSNRKQRIQAAQYAITSPVLRQLDGRAREIAGVTLKLLLKSFEQRECVGRSAGEPCDDFSALEDARLLRVRLHDGFADGDLPVAAHRDFAVAADGKDGCRAKYRECHTGM